MFNRERPDEFAVQRQAPLVVPPDFNLVPPAPGTPRPAEGTAAEQALDALFGGPAPRSQVETSALDRAGAAEPGIRSKVGDPDTNTRMLEERLQEARFVKGQTSPLYG